MSRQGKAGEKGAAARTGHHEVLARADDVSAPTERSFGRTFFVVLSLLAAWSGWRHGLAPLPIGLAAAAVVFLGLGYLAPVALRPLNLLWFRFGLLLHAVVNPLILGLLYFLVLTPTGIIMRMAGKDFLGLRRSGPTYWIARDPEQAQSSTMINQF